MKYSEYLEITELLKEREGLMKLERSLKSSDGKLGLLGRLDGKDYIDSSALSESTVQEMASKAICEAIVKRLVRIETILKEFDVDVLTLPAY